MRYQRHIKDLMHRHHKEVAEHLTELFDFEKKRIILIGQDRIIALLCQGEVKVVNLGEEMMRLALRQGGEVKWIEENPILKANDGVVGSLRFRSSL